MTVSPTASAAQNAAPVWFPSIVWNSERYIISRAAYVENSVEPMCRALLCGASQSGELSSPLSVPFSRRRDCHSAAPPSPFSRCFNMDGEGMSVK